jgi:hypothetical protein
VRALATWLVAGAVVVVGVAAAADALRADGQSRSSAPGGDADAAALSSTSAPPAIRQRSFLAARLRAEGADGVLEVTDRRCRRFRLRLPELLWTSPVAEARPPCRERVVRSPEGDLAAYEEGDDVIVFSNWPGWRARFEGIAPSFRPDGILTFLRHGELFEWSGRCPDNARLVNFRTEHEVRRCVRPVLRRPLVAAELRRSGVRLSGYDLAATTWLGASEVAVVVRGRAPEEAVVAIFADGRLRAVHTTFATRLGHLAASPERSFIVAALTEPSELAVLDRNLRVQLFPSGVARVRVVSWSPDERWAAAVTPRGVELFRTDARGTPIRLPLHAIDVEWR